MTDSIQTTMPVMPTGMGGGFGNGFGDGNGMWLVLFFLVLLGGGGWGNGWGGGSMNGYSQSNDFSSLERENDIIRSDICNGFSNTNQILANGFQTIQTSFANAELSRSNTQAALMNQMYNMSMADLQRSCDAQAAITNGFAQTNYNLSQQGCETRNTIQNGNRDIIEKLNQMEFNTLQREADALRTENQGLKFQISQGAQNAYLVSTLRPYPIPTFTVVPPGTTADSGAAAAKSVVTAG